MAQEDKGPSAKEVMLLGSAGNQVQQMKAMGYGGYTWGKGDWGGKGWGGKGWDWGGKGYGGYDVYMPMQMPIPWGKGGYGKGGFGWWSWRIQQDNRSWSFSSWPRPPMTSWRGGDPGVKRLDDIAILVGMKMERFPKKNPPEQSDVRTKSFCENFLIVIWKAFFRERWGEGPRARAPSWLWHTQANLLYA